MFVREKWADKSSITSALSGLIRVLSSMSLSPRNTRFVVRLKAVWGHGFSWLKSTHGSNGKIMLTEDMMVVQRKSGIFSEAEGLLWRYLASAVG